MNWREPIERFMDFVSPEPNTGCWLWTGYTDNGYGIFYPGSKSGKTNMVKAHRWLFEHERGPIPQKLHIDHICRVRCCVNPQHLRAVTQRENTLAPGSLSPSKLHSMKTHCPKGHPYSPENTYFYIKPRFNRQCKICTLEHCRRSRQAKRLQ